MIDTKHCDGCQDDFYNGKNPYGVQKCWHAEKATMVNRILVPIWMPPPYTRLPIKKMPNCYKAKGAVTVKPDSLTSDGYWKR